MAAIREAWLKLHGGLPRECGERHDGPDQLDGTKGRRDDVPGGKAEDEPPVSSSDGVQDIMKVSPATP